MRDLTPEPAPTRRNLLAGAGALGMAALVPPAAHAAPAARLIDPRWTRFGTQGDPDHGAWDAILSAGLRRGGDGIARFDYAATSRARVDAYVAGLARVDPGTLTSGAAFAYWVNLYNAVTVQIVLGAYPVSSIREIGGGLFSSGPWRSASVRVADVALSLDDIEHGILRPVWRDPRIHYAVNCASLGCPDLAGRAYVSGRLGQMLDAGARAYVAHPRGARVGSRGVTVSSIYDWFSADFGGSAAGVLEHLAAFAPAAKAAEITAAGRIAGYAYDWALNDV